MFVCPSVRANLSAKQAAEAFDRLKTLEGTWQGISERGGRASLTISVIGRGSAVVETYRDADNDQMVTVYYLDGERLMLRHYCVAKNQPRMEATTFDPSTGDLRFEFVDATNLAPGAGHMHEITIRMVDRDHLVSGARYFKDEKPLFSESTAFTRLR